MNGSPKYFVAALLAALLTACGGGVGQSDDRELKSVVSFGDSLSDVGTFSPNAASVMPQGVTAKFTTNGVGQTIWVENIAARVGAVMVPYQTALTPPSPLTPTVTTLGGNGYAVGGGTAFATTTTQVVPNVNYKITEQVDDFLARNGSFRNDQLVLVWIGGNDIAAALQAGAGATAVVQGAASTTIQQIARIAAAGGRYIIVNNAPDIGKTPRIAAAGSTAVAGARALAQAFNAGLAAGIQALNNPNIVLVDIFALFDDAVANPAQYGFTNVTAPGCADVLGPSVPANDPRQAQNPVNNSLFCTTSTLAAPEANTRYLFADTFHPSTGGHLAVTNKVVQTAAGRVPGF
ncbi:MAG TPA: SGNH/GDSL hydrolase family protein [Burkholderiaceae bacterium]|nr:SGNH/GDSL hydrolase family protein [Burkholderiaceae bacterium]